MIPLFDELLEITCYVLLELANALGAEGVRDSFPFTRVFGAVACVEEASLDRDEGVVVVTIRVYYGQLSLISCRGLAQTAWAKE